MNCQEIRPMLGAYVDNELDIPHLIEIEHHLGECHGCSQALETLSVMSASLKSLSARESPAPAHVRDEVRRRLRKTASISGGTWMRWSSLAAAAVMILVAGGFIGRMLPRSSSSDAVHEVLTSHVRSLIPGHLLDVPSSDRHTVKPWFAGKIDYSPPVDDFAAQGFPLVGGRLDYVEGRAVAVTVYKRRQHIINCYIWPEAGGNTGIHSETQNGFHIKHWRRSGMSYTLVSDMNDAELGQLADLLRGGS